MSDDNPKETSGDGPQEGLTQPAIPEHVRDALQAAAEKGEDRAALMDQVRSLGLVEEGETISVAEARDRLERHQVEQAEAARAIIAGTESEQAASEPLGRDEQGHELRESKFDPEHPMPRLNARNPKDQNLIRETVEWYAQQFEWDELTPDQALNLLIDARAQGLYRRDKRDKGTHARMPAPVADEALRARIAEVFGEGTDNQGRGEERLEELRAARRQGRQAGEYAGNADTERRRWNLGELQQMVGVLEQRVNELRESNPDSVSEWRQILDDFITEDVIFYDDEAEGEAKGRPASNVKNFELRKKAWNVFREAERRYLEARKKAESVAQQAERVASSRQQASAVQETASQVTQGQEPVTQGSATSQESTPAPAAISDDLDQESGTVQTRAPKIPAKLRNGEVRPSNPEDTEDEYRYDLASSRDARDPYDFEQDARRRPEPDKSKLRLEREYGLNNSQEETPEPQEAEEQDTAKPVYDESLEPLMKEAYNRDPGAKAAEEVRRRLQPMVDAELDEDARARLEAKMKYRMDLARKEAEALREQERRERVRRGFRSRPGS